MFVPMGFGVATYFWRRIGDNEEMVTSFGVQTIGDPPTVSDANEVFDAWASSTLPTGTTDATGLVRTELSIAVDEDDVLITSQSTVPEDFGANSGDPCPQNCALLVRKNTTFGGRKNKGRFYYPDLQRTEISPAGIIDPASLIFYQDAVDDWMGNLDSVGVVTGLRILHTSEADPPTPVVAHAVQNRIATQRRRLRA